VGVVNVRHETCQGCFVHIPPQMFIEVQKNNEIIRCPNCNRILYFGEGRPGKMRDLSTEPSGEKGLQFNLYIDGASKGNPGMAGAGVWVTNQAGKNYWDKSIPRPQDQ